MFRKSFLILVLLTLTAALPSHYTIITNTRLQTPIMQLLYCEGTLIVPDPTIIATQRGLGTFFGFHTRLAETYFIFSIPLSRMECIFVSNKITSLAQATRHVFFFDFLPVQHFSTQ